MNAWRLFVAALGVGFISTYSYVSGAARSAKALQRARFRGDRLLAACQRLEQERSELNAFLEVVVPTDWEA